MSRVIVPPTAKFVGLEQSDGRSWVRIEQPQLRAGRNDPRGIWWDASKVDPIAVAAQLGGGTFRVLFAPKDRRYRMPASQPVTVAAAPGALVGEDGDEDEFEDGDEDDLEDGDEDELDEEDDGEEDELEAEPVDDRQLPLPNVAPPVAAAPAPPPPPAPRPAPRAPAPAPRPMPRAHQPAPVTPPQHGAQLGPLEQLIYLNQMAEAQYARNHQMMFGAMQMMLESQNARSAETLAFERQRSEQLLAMQREHTDRVTRELALSRAPSPELAQVVNAVNLLAGRVDALSSDREDDADDVRQHLAQLSDNPNDTERIVAGVQNVIQAVLQSPVGPAIASAVAKRFGFGGAEAAMPPAAE